jgi:hypothetical protein
MTEEKARFFTSTPRVMAGVFVFTTLVLSTPLFFGRVYGDLDLARLEVGTLCALREQIARGDGLFVSTFIGNGAPLWAWHFAELVYPPRWVQMLFPPEVGASLGVIFHLGVAAAGSVGLARTFGLGHASAALVGFVFAFNGTALDLISKAGFAVGAAWLPLVWLAVRLGLKEEEKAGRWVFACGLFLALMLLGGEPQAFAIGSGLVILEGFFFLRGKGARSAARPALFAGTIVCAIALGWILWGPALAESALGNRLGGLSEAETMQWGFGPLQWLAAFWPGAALGVGSSGLNLIQVTENTIHMEQPWNARPYIGLLPLVLVALSISQRKLRSAVVVAAVGMMLALGDLLPLLPLAHKIFPPLSAFRYPAKYLPIAMLGIALLAGAGHHRILHKRAKDLPLKRWLTVALMVQGLGIGALLFFTGGLNRAELVLAGPGANLDLPLSSVLLTSALQAGVAPILALGLLFLAPGRLPWLGLIVVVDLVAAAPGAVSTTQRDLPLSSPLTTLSADVDVAPHAIPVLCVSEELAHLRPVVEGADGSSRTLSLLDMGKLWGVPEMQACSAVSGGFAYASQVETRAELELMRGFLSGNGLAARALGCSHAVTLARPQGVENASAEPRLFPLPDPIPPSFVARDPIWTHEEDLPKEVSNAKSTTDLLALVDDPRGSLTQKTALPSGQGITAGPPRWEGRHHAVVEVKGTGAGVVGLRTAYWTGWAAHQAGRALPVLRVGFRQVGALVENAEQGPITFVYQPPRWIQGWVVFGLGAFLLALLSGLATRLFSTQRLSAAQGSEKQ